jgi:hypothetical protein
VLSDILIKLLFFILFFDAFFLWNYLAVVIDFEKERTGQCEDFFISACRLYYDQIYNCNLEISPTQAILKRNCQN